MTVDEAFRAARRAATWDEYRRLLNVAQEALLAERAQLFSQHDTHNRKAAR